MDCPNCEKQINALPVAEIIEEDRIGAPPVEVVAIFLTCEHCKAELYGSVSTSIIETI